MCFLMLQELLLSPFLGASLLSPSHGRTLSFLPPLFCPRAGKQEQEVMQTSRSGENKKKKCKETKINRDEEDNINM